MHKEFTQAVANSRILHQNENDINTTLSSLGFQDISRSHHTSGSINRQNNDTRESVTSRSTRGKDISREQFASGNNAKAVQLNHADEIITERKNRSYAVQNNNLTSSQQLGSSVYKETNPHFIASPACELYLNIYGEVISNNLFSKLSTTENHSSLQVNLNSFYSFKESSKERGLGVINDKEVGGSERKKSDAGKGTQGTCILLFFLLL